MFVGVAKKPQHPDASIGHREAAGFVGTRLVQYLTGSLAADRAYRFD
jgi:hypothetical protein